MSQAMDQSDGYDVFLSHASPDKPWVRTLAEQLRDQGLRAYLDERELRPGDNFVLTLSDALRKSRFLVLVLTSHSVNRPWVEQEWTSFMAAHGPVGRLIPVLLDSVQVPTILRSVQYIRATHRDPARVAREVAERIGRPSELKEGDARGLYIGQSLAVVLEPRDGGKSLHITDPVGRGRDVTPPWRVDTRFTVAYLGFNKLTQEAIRNDTDRAELTSHATMLGELFFDLLFDARCQQLLREATIPGQPRPLVSILSEDDLLLSLPWELIHHDGSFLVRDGRVDLARSQPGPVASGALRSQPTGPFSLVVNVSAPERSGLNYEAESYRITRALSEQCKLAPTELGTLEDLVETVKRVGPTGIHFSGHGGPGRLLFEDDEGREAPVPVQEMVERLRQRLPGELPPFFYLASCHGNDPGRPEEGQAGPESSAARLHRGGVAQVVGYYGPIADELSTRAEVALYAAIAEGQTTRYAVRQARAALAAPSSDFDEKHRPVRQDGRETKDDDRTRNGAGSLGTARSSVTDSASHPFAWAQLVFYHRGVDYPLSVPARSGQRLWQDEPPQRVWQGVGDRRVLVTGFIGRRREQHRVRGWIREGRRVFVFQGLGGLGKSTLAFHVLPMLGEPRQICTLWCQEAAKQPNRAEALVEQLLEYCRKLFGADWEAVVQHVDRVAGGDPGERFGYFLATVLENVPRLVVYLDNMESLLVGPEESLGEAPPEPEAFAEWHSPALAAIWQVLTRFAHDGGKLYVVASCRYRHDDFRGALIPVSPLPDDALFRLMGWFPALRQLAGVTRARLVDRLDGHPRAVEFANDLVQDRVDRWEEDRGEWRPSGPSTPDTLHLEWDALVEPALPQVRAKLWDNLLLARIWDRVLDDRARRMLFRTTLLRRPWEWDLMGVLGEPDEPEAAAMATAERLRRTSLLEQMELFGRRPDGTIGTLLRHTVHAATAQFISARFGDDEPLRLASHRRVGEYLEAQAKISPYVEVGIEAGHHLFHAGEYDRACKLLRAASVWLQNRGRVREALQILKPVLAGTVRQTMDRQHVGRLLGTAGSGYLRLGQVDKAIGYHEQALVINREIGDRQGEGSALGNLEVAYLRLGQADKAIRYYEDALMIDREIGNRQGEGSNLGNLGLAYADLGQADKAIGYYERCLVIHREIGDRQGEANALGNLGIAYAHLGQSEKAIGCYEQALDIGREIKDPRIIEFASRQLERLRRGPPAIP